MRDQDRTRDARAGSYLRHEAEARCRFKLDEAQKHALERIALGLKDALGYLDGANGRGTNPQRPRESNPRRPVLNVNRLCFLSGVRGTGKTTVLYSLLDGLEDLATGRECGCDGVEREGRDPLVCLSQDHARRIIVLDTLDMEPLGEPVNLLAAILARIEAVAQYPADEWERTSLDRGASPYARAFDELSRLQTDATLAWASDLPQRGQLGDPETLASETRRVEFARIGLVGRVEATLKTLADNVRRDTAFPPPYPPAKDRLFLLPVDDFDLNPTRCLELLKLLRMLSVPHLFTVIVGHVDTAEMIFGLKMWGGLAAVAGPSAPALLELVSQTQAPSLFAQAHSLAAEALRKLVPPGQVIRLEEMRVSEASAYPAQGAAGTTLQQQLQRFPLKRLSTAATIQPGEGAPFLAMMPIANLETFLLVRQPFMATEPTGDDNKDHQERRARTEQAHGRTRWNADQWYAYPGAAVLHAPPRRIADTWAELDAALAESERTPQPDDERLAQREPLDLFMDFLVESYRRAVREDDTFDPAERELLLDAVRRDFRGRWQFQTDRILPIHYAPGPEVPIECDWKLDGLVAKRAIFRRWNDWDLMPNSKRARRRLRKRQVAKDPRVDWPRPTPHSHMTDQLEATIMVLHDLLFLTDAVGLAGPALVPCLDGAIAETRVEIDGALVAIEWPLPRWQTFWEFSLIRSAWNAEWYDAHVQRHSNDRAQRLAYRLLMACTAMLAGRPPIERLQASSQLKAALGNPCPPKPPTAEVEGAKSQATAQAEHRDELAPPGQAAWEALGTALGALVTELPKEENANFSVRQALVSGWLCDAVAIAALAAVGTDALISGLQASLDAPKQPVESEANPASTDAEGGAASNTNRNKLRRLIANIQLGIKTRLLPGYPEVPLKNGKDPEARVLEVLRAVVGSKLSEALTLPAPAGQGAAR